METNICIICEGMGVVNRGIESFNAGLINETKRVEADLNYTLISGGEVKNKNICLNKAFPHIYVEMPKFLDNRFTKKMEIFGIAPRNLWGYLTTLTLIPFLISRRFNFYIPSNYYQLLACRLVRALKRERSKIVYVGHAGPGHDDYKALICAPDLFIALTKPYMDWLYKLKFKPKRTEIRLIPLGVDAAVFNPKVAKATNPFNNKLPIVMCIGALVPYKRQHLAVQALKDQDRYNLLIIGSGIESSKIRKIASEGYEGGLFHHISELDHSNVASYFALADVVLLTSTTRENSPTVLIESLLTGTPVVATDFDRARWIVGEGGIYIDPTKKKEILSALDEILSEYKRYSKLAVISGEKFKWKKIANSWLILFRNNL